MAYNFIPARGNNKKKQEESATGSSLSNYRLTPARDTTVAPPRQKQQETKPASTGKNWNRDLFSLVDGYSQGVRTAREYGRYDGNAWDNQYKQIHEFLDSNKNNIDDVYYRKLVQKLDVSRKGATSLPAYGGTIDRSKPAFGQPASNNKADVLRFVNQATGASTPQTVQHHQNMTLAKNTYDYLAGGGSMDNLSYADLKDYQQMAPKVSDYFDTLTAAWKNRNNGGEQTVGGLQMTADEAQRNAETEIRKRNNYPDYWSFDNFTDEEKQEVNDARAAAESGYTTQTPKTMPSQWEMTGNINTASDMIGRELENRDFQKKYAQLTYSDDFAEGSKYQRKFLDQQDVVLGGQDAKRNAELLTSLHGDDSYMKKYYDIYYEAVNGNKDAINYLRYVKNPNTGEINDSANSFVEEYMNDYEREIFRYVFNTQGAEAAEEYVDGIRYDLTKRAYYAADEEFRQRLQNSDLVSLGLANLASVPLNLAQGAGNFLGQAAEMIMGRQVNPYNYGNPAATIRDETEQMIVRGVEEAGGGDFAKTLASMGYNAVMSGLDSSLSLALGSGVAQTLGLAGGAANTATQYISLGLMSSGAASNTLNNELMIGIPQGRAALDAMTAGIIEFATEKIGMDNLFNNIINGRGNFMSYMKQVLAEGAEELVGDVATDAINQLYDIIGNTSYSELNRQANAYWLENGMAPSQRNEAMAHVLMERLQEYAIDTAVGSLSVITGEGSVGAIANFNNAKALTSHLDASTAQDVIQEGLTLDPNSRAYKGAMALQERMMNEFNPVAITPKEVQRLARDIVYEVQGIENDTDRKQAEQDMFKAFGIDRFLHPDVQTTSEQLRTTNDPNAGEFEVNRTEDDAVKAAQDAEQKRIDDSTINSIINEATSNNTTVNPDEIARRVHNVTEQDSADDLSDILTPEQVQTVAEIASRNSAAQAVQNAMDAIAEKSVPVRQEEATEETVQETIEEEPVTEQEQPAMEVDTSGFANTLTPAARQVYEQTLAEARQNGMNAADATQAFLEVYTAGTHQVPYAPSQNNRRLSGATRAMISQTAQRESTEYTTSLEQKGFAKSAAAGTQVQTSKGLVATPVLARAVQDGRISQRTADVMNKLGQMLGVRINVLSTNPKYNGEYKAQKADINLYLDAKFFNSKTTDEAVIGVLGHELSHRLEDISPEAYRQLTAMVMDTMGNNGFARMVQHNMRLAPGMTILQAQGEVVSDFVGTMLFRDSDFADRFIGNVQVQTAEQRTALQGLRDFVHKVIDWIRGNKDAFKEPEKTITWMEKLENTLTSLIEQSAEAVGESTNVVEPTVETPSNYEDGIRPSIKSLGDAANIDVQMDEKTGEVYFQIDGKKVTNVSAEHIKSSGIGAMIKLSEQNGNIKPADAKKQYQAFADIMNMVMTTQNPDLVWQYVGAEIFSAVKSNSDNQYGTTVDMSTICKKTQDMITAMSSAMVAAKRGLTISEVTELQNRINNNGMQVPCPVCYVFSRWAGIGSVLDQMYNFQQKYPPEMPMEEIRAAYDRLSKEKAADTKRRLLAEDAAYKDLSDTLAKQRKRKRELGAEIRKATDQAEKDRLVEERSQVDKLITEYKNMMKAMETAGAEASWLMRTRMSDTYRPVPADILFDLDAGKTLASEYPDSWNFRMTRGAGKGKAILPYSDFRFGALVDGPKNKGRLLERGPEVLKTGEFNKDQMKLIETAMLRTLAQNLIGGQRYQSTSDFRYDYALDYLMSFLEAQALGSNLQTYTKVVEYAELIAAVGGDVNLSVMPLERGYDENGKLIYSSVTGINYDAAVKASHMYDSAQLILVGINDRHIALALADPEIGFVIPWHASGASNDFTSSLLRNLGESYNSDYYQNYEAVQNDHLFYDGKNKRQGTTRDQDYKRDLRKKILTGEALSQGDIDFLEGLNESADITDMTFEELRDIERHALAGNQEALSTYLSWSDGILYDLYKKMTSPKYEKVKLSTSQSASVMPHEYWNTDTTLDNAYVNGFIFRSYCYSMGLHPRFTGYNSAGKHLNFGDFSNEIGYWKTLIDRPMYNNDGTYRAQQAVNLNNFQKEMLLPEYRNVNWSEYATNMPDANKAKAVGTEYGESIRHSVKDADYLAAVNAGDMEAAQRMVDEAAKEAGYNIKGYHGTRENFTIFDKRYRNYDAEPAGFIYVTTDKGYAQEYARDPEGLDTENEAIYNLYAKANNPLNIGEITVPVEENGKPTGDAIRVASAVGQDVNTFINSFPDYYDNDLWVYVNTPKFANLVSSLGYDSIHMTENGNEAYGVLDSNQVKSADPVTYDDAGNVIPLSERFNTENPDIRYSRRDNSDQYEYRDIVELNQQRERTMKLLDTASQWRRQTKNISRDRLARGTEAILDQFGDTLSKDQRNGISSKVYSLARDIVNNPKLEYGDILLRANNIASDIVFGNVGIDNAQAKKMMEGDRMSGTAVDYISNILLDNIISTQDKALREVKQQYERNERLNDTLREVRAKRDQKIREDIDRRQAQREKRRDSKERTYLLEVMNRLEKLAKKSSAEQAEEIHNIIGEFDLTCKGLTEGKIAKLEELKEWVDQRMQEDPLGFAPNPNVLKAIEGLNAKHIANLTIDEVRNITRALLNIEHEIREGKYLAGVADRRDTNTLGREVIEGVNNSRDKAIKHTKGIDGLYNEVVRPETFFLRQVGFDKNNPWYQLTFGDELSLSTGQRAMIDYNRRAHEKYFRQYLDDKAFQKSIIGKNARAVEIRGIDENGNMVKLKVTPDLLMAIYMHGQNDQNLKHFVDMENRVMKDGKWTTEIQKAGGMTVPDFELYRAGKIEEAYRKGTKITMRRADVRHIASQLTPKEMGYVHAAQKYYSEMSQPEINRVSEILNGYSLANVDNYFRINTDKAYIKADSEAIKFDAKIESQGWTKERMNASNPIMLYSLTDQLQRDIDGHSKYVGLAIPIRNFDKVRGVNQYTYNDDGSVKTAYASSVVKAIDKMYGKKALDYINKLMADIQMPQNNQDFFGKLLAKVRGHYAGAVLTLNLGVSIKQSASYPTAAAEIGWLPLVKALGNFSAIKANRLNMDLVYKYSPLMRLRTEGISTQELGEMKEQGRSIPKLLNWIQGMDVATVKKLWKASEYYVRANFKNLQVGSDAYYKKVGDVHTAVITKTQPNYTALQRPQILRTSNELVRTLNMFKTQPFQNLNILMESFGELKAAQRAYKINGTDENRARLATARKRAGWAVSSHVVSNLIFATMSFAAAFIMRRDDKYRDEEDELAAGTVFRKILIDMLGSDFGMMPFGSAIFETVETATDKIAKEINPDAEPIFDAVFYGIDAGTATDSINDSLKGIVNLLSNGVSLTRDLISKAQHDDFEVDWEGYTRDAVEDVMDVLMFAGVPAENGKKSAVAIAGWILEKVMGRNLSKYWTTKIVDGVKTTNKTALIKNLINTKDKEEYEQLYNTMINEPDFATTSTKDSQKYIDDKIKEYEKSQTANGMTFENQSLYDDITEELHASTAYKNAKAADQATMDQFAEDLVMKSSKAWTNARTAIENDIFTAAEYLAFMLELEKANQANTEGSKDAYSKDEQEAAIKAMGWTDEQAKKYWEYLPKGDTKNPFDPDAKTENKDSKKEEAKKEDVASKYNLVSATEGPKKQSDKKKTAPQEGTLSSSLLGGYYYNNGTLQLQVNGAWYTYNNVPEEVFQGLLTAESAGNYFGKNIKGRY